MSFVKKEEGGHIKGEPGGKFDMSKIPMAPPKATSKALMKPKDEGKPNFFALPEYKPPAGRGRRKGRYRGGNHITHSVGNFRIKTVYNRDRDEVKMSVSSINAFTPSALRRARAEADWASVERTIFEKLRRAHFNIQPVPDDFGKLGVCMNHSLIFHAPIGFGSMDDSNSVLINRDVSFRVRPMNNLPQPTPMQSQVNDFKRGSAPVIKTEPSSAAPSTSSAASQELKSIFSHQGPVPAFSLFGSILPGAR